MKHFATALIIFASSSAFTTSASAASAHKPRTAQEKICDSLGEEFDLACAHLMCDDFIKDGTFSELNDCTSASDYAEAAQAACEELTTVEEMARQYNVANPGANLTCD